jgi:hypothetical protein
VRRGTAGVVVGNGINKKYKELKTEKTETKTMMTKTFHKSSSSRMNLEASKPPRPPSPPKIASIISTLRPTRPPRGGHSLVLPVLMMPN